jgi:beta-carotene ketolase (CrtO type)
MVMADHDVVIIGAGHNGLVCAVLLARAGLDVLILEQADAPGGCVWTETLASGHRLERGAVDHSMMIAMAETLGLEKFGLEYQFRQKTVAAGFGDGRSIVFDKDLAVSLDEVERFAPGDGSGYEKLAEIAGALFSLLDSYSDVPPFGEIAHIAGELPGEVDLGRLLVSSSESVLGQFLSNDQLRSVLAMYGSHSQLPGFLPGTGLFAMLLPGGHGSDVGRPIGGSKAMIDALVAALEDAGGRVQTSVRANGLSHRDGMAVLDTSGGELSTRSVISSIDVRRTVALIDDVPKDLSTAASASVSGAFNVGELKVDLALSSKATAGFGEADEAIWMLQKKSGSLRQNFADIVAGRFPDDAAMMWASPSALDSSAAPPGEGSAWLSAFVPAQLNEGGWDAKAEEEAAGWLLDGFEEITGQDVRPHVREMRVSSPGTWEERTGNPGGNPNHLDLTLDQSFSWRPPTGSAYRTSLPWLYLSGAGTHPGGGLSGLPGRGAAEALLADLGAVPAKRRSANGELRALWRSFRLYRALRRAS